MTQIRAKTLELLDSLSDEKLIYVFNILQNLEAFSRSEEMQDKHSADDAFSTLMKYSRSLPEDFDYKAELEAAREERYGSFN
ncbi:MAG: dihydrodipicolinate reductase [Lachnospiraceae bacterium]|nr:dihydrodipicolinate reductase [Lachnospiraceae bacterium]